MAAKSPSFTTIIQQEDAFRNIVQCLGEDPTDLMRLEKTCRAVRLFFEANDDIWLSCLYNLSFQYDQRLPTIREKVLTSMVVERYQLLQAVPMDNPLLIGFNASSFTFASTAAGLSRTETQNTNHSNDHNCNTDRDSTNATPVTTTSLLGFQQYLQHCVGQRDLGWNRPFPEEWVFTPETTITIAELLFSNIVRLLEQAFEFTEHRISEAYAESKEYPIVKQHDLKRAFKHIFERCDIEFKVDDQLGSRVTNNIPTFVTVQNVTVRRLSLWAGIIRLHPETFQTIWTLFLKLTILILARTGIQVVADGDPFVPLPQAVTRAAQHLQLPVTKVYLDFQPTGIAPHHESEVMVGDMEYLPDDADGEDDEDECSMQGIIVHNDDEGLGLEEWIIQDDETDSEINTDFDTD